MNISKTSVIGFAFAAAVAATAMAQQAAQQTVANPTQNCTLTPAEIAAGKKVAIAFYQPGIDRLTLADPSYLQHNPVFKKRAEENKVSDIEEFKAAFGPRQGGPGAGAGRGPAAANAPQPPGPNNQLEIVTTECDITTIVHKTWRQDPVTPGRWFEAFTFDAFRVKNGKLVEHWDTAVIAPPAAAPAGGRGN
jgi:predicted SnoaL-like aldol condensation-catalyzing enzyme